MTGVIGTRRVLAEEKYRWIAPVSAFDPKRHQRFDLKQWLRYEYPPSLLKITRKRKRKNITKLMPDYIAAKKNSSGEYELALFESKGTKNQLRTISSIHKGQYKTWYDQVTSARVLFDKKLQTIPRHIVVATRFNPNGPHPDSRELQIRAWNSKVEAPDASNPLVLEIATAYCIALCHNLSLVNTAVAIAISAHIRSGFGIFVNEQKKYLDYAISKSDTELNEKDINRDDIKISLSPGLLQLFKCLRSPDISVSLKGLNIFESNISNWVSREISQYSENPNISVDESGFTVECEDFIEEEYFNNTNEK